jgi:hypothetical protein
MSLRMMRVSSVPWWFGLFLSTCISSIALGDKLAYDSPDGRQTLDGKLVARNSEEVLFLTPDGRMHLMNAARVVGVEDTENAPKPLTQKEMEASLRGEFGTRFKVFSTQRYTICYNCSPGFARSCGRLFENLQKSFVNYFEQQAGFKLASSEFPLVAVVFGDEREFLEYATKELGEDMARNVIGYYSFLSNRMVLYDMLAAARGKGLGNVGAARPPVGPDGIDGFNAVNVGTVIHEATHQLAYNSGLHQRYSDNPLWLAEGMAMFFEAPNRQSGQWKGIGEVNRPRLDLFREQHLVAGKPFDLDSLIRTDDRLRNADTARVAYADSWALTYFLMKTRREKFFEYLSTLARKPPLGQDSPDQRLADFKSAFGDDLADLEEELVRYFRAR